jgi:DNA-binding transcriptional LysR family regulator
METALGTRCFERRPEGYPLTDQGRRLFDHAERVEQEIISLDRAVDAGDKRVTGIVAVTAVESVTTGFLLPSLRRLRQLHPGLRIEITVGAHLASLSRREVDIALRMARSEQGELLSRRIATLGFGLYASQAYLDEQGVPGEIADLSEHCLIDYLGDYPRAPPAVWFREITSRFPPFLKINGAGDRACAAELGLGITPLPYLIARSTNLIRVLREIEIPPLEMWLLAHPEGARIARVRTVMDFLAEAALEQSREMSLSPE